MIIFTRPSVILALLGLFILAAMAGGPSNGFERMIMQAIAELSPAGQFDRNGGRNNPLGGAMSRWASPQALRSGCCCAVTRSSPAFGRMRADRASSDGWPEGMDWPAAASFGVDWLPQSLAYPSGHSANSMTAFLATALIVTPPAYRGPLAAGAITLSIVVGLSRIYLGVHWPSGRDRRLGGRADRGRCHAHHRRAIRCAYAWNRAWGCWTAWAAAQRGRSRVTPLPPRKSSTNRRPHRESRAEVQVEGEVGRRGFDPASSHGPYRIKGATGPRAEAPSSKLNEHSHGLMWTMLTQRIASARSTGHSRVTSARSAAAGWPALPRQATIEASASGSGSVGCQSSAGKRRANASACSPVPLAISRTMP